MADIPESQLLSKLIKDFNIILKENLFNLYIILFKYLRIHYVIR